MALRALRTSALGAGAAGAAALLATWEQPALAEAEKKKKGPLIRRASVSDVIPVVRADLSLAGIPSREHQIKALESGKE